MRSEKRMREVITFVPKWTKDYQGWTTSFMKENMWRVDKVDDLDDLLQKSFMVFMYVAATYPRCMNSKHFFRLYKRAIINKMHDWSCRRTRRKAVEPIDLGMDISDAFLGRTGGIENAGYIVAILADAPKELKLVLDYLCKHGAQEKARRREDSPRENLSRRLCKAVGLPPSYDPMKQLKHMLTT